MDSYKVIKCPNCGYEYLPGELYLPKYFLGQPYSVDRDENYKILSSTGIEQDLHTHYICNNCNHTFQVNANITYDTYIDPIYDFNDDFKVSL